MVAGIIVGIPTDSFKSLSEALNFYLERLDNCGALKTGNFQLDLVSYTSNNSDQENVHILSHSVYPASSFAFIERSKCDLLIADNTFIDLMNKLRTLSVFKNRSSKMEARGFQFQYKDFLIHLSTVYQSQTSKGIVLEVSYGLTDNFGSAYSLIQEFLETFLNLSKENIKQLTNERIEFLKSIQERHKHSVQSTSMIILQYLDVLKKLRREPNE